ncbi:MAG: hypothetical protein JW866_05725 [Ignavibacteriales bacterium]|nr:hypothetical protein [Ignavibacteriales bacterium]
MKNKFIILFIISSLIFCGCGSFEKTGYPDEPFNKILNTSSKVMISTKDSLVIMDYIADFTSDTIYFHSKSTLPISRIDSIYVFETNWWSVLLTPILSVGFAILIIGAVFIFQ